MTTKQNDDKNMKKFEKVSDITDMINQVIRQEMAVEYIYASTLDEIHNNPDDFFLELYWVGQGNKSGFLKEVRNTVLEVYQDDPENDMDFQQQAVCTLLKVRWGAEAPKPPRTGLSVTEEHLQKLLSDESFTSSQLGSFEMLNFDNRQWRILLGHISDHNLFDSMCHAYFAELWFRKEAIMDGLESMIISNDWLFQSPTDALRDILYNRRKEIGEYQSKLYDDIELFAEHLQKVREELKDHKGSINLDVEWPQLTHMVCSHIMSSELNGFDIDPKACDYLRSKGFDCGVGERDSFGPVTIYLAIVDGIMVVI